MWQSKRLRGIVKSVMAAEALIQVESTEDCFLTASLLNKILYNKPITKEWDADNHQLYDPIQSIWPIKGGLSGRMT